MDGHKSCFLSSTIYLRIFRLSFAVTLQPNVRNLRRIAKHVGLLCIVFAFVCFKVTLDQQLFLQYILERQRHIFKCLICIYAEEYAPLLIHFP